MMSLSGEVSSTVLDDANDYHSVVNTTVFFMMVFMEHLLCLCVISLARFDLMRMVLHCTIAAKCYGV
jgi:hypothetical protein